MQFVSVTVQCVLYAFIRIVRVQLNKDSIGEKTSK